MYDIVFIFAVKFVCNDVDTSYTALDVKIALDLLNAHSILVNTLSESIGKTTGKLQKASGNIV